MQETRVDRESAALCSDLVDLTAVDLDTLASLDDSVLAGAFQAVRDEIDGPVAAVAGFASSL